MWIFLNNAFLSIVVDGEGPANNLLVRARAPGDIERVFKGRKVVQTPGRDYHFRASIPRDVVAGVIEAEVLGIDYGNFKDSVAANDRHDAYLSVWAAMFRFQRARACRSLLDDDPLPPQRTYNRLASKVAQERPKKRKRRGKRGGKKRKTRSLRRGA